MIDWTIATPVVLYIVFAAYAVRKEGHACR
jgi:hypothetical protein